MGVCWCVCVCWRVSMFICRCGPAVCAPMQAGCIPVFQGQGAFKNVNLVKLTKRTDKTQFSAVRTILTGISS